MIGACDAEAPLVTEDLVEDDVHESADGAVAAGDAVADSASTDSASADSASADLASADLASADLVSADVAFADMTKLDSDAAQDDVAATDAVALDTAVSDVAPTQDADAAPDGGPGLDSAADAAADAEPAAPLKLGNVQVQPVANNPLACLVTWKSNLPASSVVLFGLGAPTMRMTVPDLVTDHQVLVVGMRSSQTYQLQVRSKTANGKETTQQAPTFATGALPEYLKAAPPSVPWSDTQEPHFLVLAGIHLNLPFGFNPYDFPPTAVIYDDQGQVVWFHSQSKGSNIVAWWEYGKILVAGGGPALQLNLAGDTLWQNDSIAMGNVEGAGPPQPVTGMMHGDLRLLPNGNLLGIEFDVQNGIWGDQLAERKPDGSLVWTWSTFDHLVPGEGDWAHGNSLQPLDNGDTVLYSPRNLNMIFKIDRKTGQFVMRLGAGGDYSLQPGSGDDWFALQHSAEELPGNRILMYDNGTMERGYSRAVEYQYNLNTKQAKIIWQYKGEPGETFFSPGQGSVQRLPNGDTLVSAPDWKAGFAMPSSLRRVSQQGQLRWRLNLPVVYDYPTVAYRAQRVDLPGLEFIAPGQVP